MLSAQLSAALRAQRTFDLSATEGAGDNGFRVNIEFVCKGGEGTFTSPAANAQWQIRSVESDLYVSASEAQWRRTFQYQGDSSRKLALVMGRYMQVRPQSKDLTTTSFAEMAGWANRDKLIEMFFGIDAIGQTTFVDRGRSFVAGRSVVRYDSKGGPSPGFELDVAATGPPVPVRVATAPSSAMVAAVDFTRYGAQAKPILRPPASQVVQASDVYPEPAR